jgi:hypothetical protein
MPNDLNVLWGGFVIAVMMSLLAKWPWIGCIIWAVSIHYQGRSSGFVLPESGHPCNAWSLQPRAVGLARNASHLPENAELPPSHSPREINFAIYYWNNRSGHTLGGLDCQIPNAWQGQLLLVAVTMHCKDVHFLAKQNQTTSPDSGLTRPI